MLRLTACTRDAGRGCEGEQRTGILCPRLTVPREAGGAGPLITVATDLALDLPQGLKVSMVPQAGSRGWEGWEGWWL